MAMLHRDDGAQFVLQPYREVLKQANRAILKKEIRLLSENYGGFARIFKQKDGSCEVIYSRDYGNLIGEGIWNYFTKPDNLIYAEMLSDHKILLIVVRGGLVYVDAVLDYADVLNELVSQIVADTAFQIYVYGDVPFGNSQQLNKYVIAANNIKTFTYLDEPVYPILPALPAYQLMPIDRAIETLKLDQRFYSMCAIAVMIVVALGIWWMSNNSSDADSNQVTQQADPAQQYKAVLTTPAPADLMRQMAKETAMLYSLPGWIPTQLDYVGGTSISVQAHSMGASISSLLAWSRAQNIDMNITPEGALLSLPLQLSNRTDIGNPIDSQQTLALVVDRMMQVFPGRSVKVGQVEQHGMFKETHVTLLLNNMSPDMFDLLAKQLQALPLTLSSANFNYDSGLLSGSIELIVVGS